MTLNYSAKAQEVDINKILINNIWKADVEAMKLQMLLKVASLPEMKELSAKEKEVIIKASIQTVEKMRYEFYENMEYKISLVGSDKNQTFGKFSINKFENKLTLISDDLSKEYSIISVTENRINLKSTSNRLDLILINQ